MPGSSRPGRPAERSFAGLSLVAAVTLAAAGCSDSLEPDTEVLGRFVVVSAGAAHACAANAGGEVFCWGANEQAQLGVPPSSAGVPRPVLTQLGTGVVEVTTGMAYTCARDGDGDARCWGDGRLGQLGWGQLFSSANGIELEGGPWEAVSAGAFHACALRAGEPLCWGADRYGASLGHRVELRSHCVRIETNENWPCALSPTALDAGRPFVEISAGLWHTCARGEPGSVWCWGVNTLGQLGVTPSGECIFEDPTHGDAHFPCAWDPVPVGFPEPATSVRSGAAHSCAVLQSGALHCWGLVAPIYSGQLGHGGSEGSQAPVRVAGGQQWAKVAVSRVSIFASTCALTTGGEAWCWGVGRSGALGAPPPSTCSVAGGAPCALEPIRVETEARFTDIAVGDEFACGVTTEQRVLCWGANDLGQLGDGTFTSRSEPAPITGFGWTR